MAMPDGSGCQFHLTMQNVAVLSIASTSGQVRSTISQCGSLGDNESMMVEREKLFQENGALRGVSYAKGHNRRGAILNVGIDRKAAKKLVTSLIVDGRDFFKVYRQMVYMIADHYCIPHHHDLVAEMLNSKDAFLRANGLTTKPVCYEQVVLADEYHGYVGTGDGAEVALAVGKHRADVQCAAEAECEARGIENWDWWINEVEVHRRDRTGRAVAGIIRSRLSSVAGLEEVGTEFSLDDD